MEGAAVAVAVAGAGAGGSRNEGIRRVASRCAMSGLGSVLIEVGGMRCEERRWLK